MNLQYNSKNYWQSTEKAFISSKMNQVEIVVPPRAKGESDDYVVEYINIATSYTLAVLDEMPEARLSSDLYFSI